MGCRPFFQAARELEESLQPSPPGFLKRFGLRLRALEAVALYAIAQLLLRFLRRSLMGRPRLAKTAKDVLIGARFGSDESGIVQDAVDRAKIGKSEWVRKTLLKAAKL